MLDEDVEEIEELLQHPRAGLYGVEGGDPGFVGRGLQTFADLKASVHKSAAKDLIKLYEELVAEGTRPEDYVSNLSYMSRYIQELNLINNEVETINKKIKELNYRQKKLELELKHFPEIIELKRDLRFFVDLWEVANSYLKNKNKWWTDKISEMDSDGLLDQANEWDKIVQQSLKSEVITRNEKPNLMLTYVQSELETIQKYFPLVATLRHKALLRRHYDQMSKELGM
jgi:hypothetical protein